MATKYQGSINITTEQPNLFSNIRNVSISNAFRNIGNHFQSVGEGAISEVITVNSGNVLASVTFTIASGNLSNNDTLTINGTTFTAKTSAPSGAVQFLIGSYAVPTAVNLANIINAHPVVSLLFRATVTQGTSEAGIITITELVPSGTAYTLSKSATNGTLSSTTLQGAAGPVSASDVFTITASNLSASDTVTIGGIVFTAETSGAVGNQFNVGASALATAQNLAAAINAYVSTATVVSAVATGTTTGIVTVTMLMPGLLGNMIPVAKSAANGSWSHTTFFVGGLDANVATFHHGF